MKITVRATALHVTLAAISAMSIAPTVLFAATTAKPTVTKPGLTTSSLGPRPSCGYNDPVGCGILK